MNLGMLKLFKLFFIILFFQNVYALDHKLNFDLIQKGKIDNNTLLVVGGIQGDEPGGFMAASLIATHYNIIKGSVWVVPNLNFDSIIKSSRGPYGDMNRKFAKLSQGDPDYKDVERIKDYITAPEVKLVLNLHDGSGYYRKKYEDDMHSPRRWGQSSIVDQSSLNVPLYGNLEQISQRICNYVNKNLIREEDSYLVHNTRTIDGDKEMEKTLTYFAINNGKAAFGNEASKQLPVHERVYYHLLALEEYMNVMGIEFERKFVMNPDSVRKVIDHDIYITFYDEKIKLPLSQVRKYLRYFPIKKDGTIDFKASNPVITIIKNKNSTYTIHYGNRKLAVLKPDFQDLDSNKDSVRFKIDGKIQDIKIGSLITVTNEFYIYPEDKYRVNVIGYINQKQKNESGLSISKKEIAKRFSVDKKGKIYRVEFYKGDKFNGMVMVKFDEKIYNADENYSALLTEATKAPEKYN